MPGAECPSATGSKEADDGDETRAAFLGGLLAVTLMTQAPAIGQQRPTEWTCCSAPSTARGDFKLSGARADLHGRATVRRCRADVDEGARGRSAGRADPAPGGRRRATGRLALPARRSRPRPRRRHVKEPKKIKDVKPVYPDLARASAVQGIVILEVVIDLRRHRQRGRRSFARWLCSTTRPSRRSVSGSSRRRS